MRSPSLLSYNLNRALIRINLIVMSLNLLIGSKVRLTAVTLNDLSTIAQWYDDPEFSRLLDARPASPQSEEMLKSWLEERQKSTDAFVFGVRCNDREDLVGVVEFEGILWHHQVSWVCIAIGDRAHWGKGYGYDAMQLALEYAFNAINLYRVQLTVFSYNERAIALYEKLGFKREGIYREFVLHEGDRYDMYLYSLLRHEWEEKQRQK